MSSLSSSGAVLSFPVSASSLSLPSSRSARSQWQEALSVRAAKRNCYLVDVSGRTDRVMAALRRRRVYFIFVLPALLDGLCRHLLSTAARRDVCSVL